MHRNSRGSDVREGGLRLEPTRSGNQRIARTAKAQDPRWRNWPPSGASLPMTMPATTKPAEWPRPSRRRSGAAGTLRHHSPVRRRRLRRHHRLPPTSKRNRRDARRAGTPASPRRRNRPQRPTCSINRGYGGACATPPPDQRRPSAPSMATPMSCSPTARRNRNRRPCAWYEPRRTLAPSPPPAPAASPELPAPLDQVAAVVKCQRRGSTALSTR